jgi:DNA polymerase V
MSDRLALVDCNNFYCSCERVFQPRLVGIPIVVLSNNDGCIISRSEEAKALGIPMGAPLHEQQETIRKHGVQVLSSNYTLYGDMSARVMSILTEEVPAIEVYSIDEAFLQLPLNFNEEMGKALRAKVLKYTGIPVCIGIGTTKLLAKLANRYAKKNKNVTGGVFDLSTHWDSEGIMHETMTEDLWGVGRNLARRLSKIGVTTALEFKNADPAAVRKSIGVIGERLQREMNGIRCLELEEVPQDKKSVMASRSFGTPVEALGELEEAVANHVARASEKIRRGGLLASSIVVMLRTNRFKPNEPQYCPSTRFTLENPSSSTSELMTIARQLLHRIYRPCYRYKKAGILLEGLVAKNSYQPSLFEASAAPKIDVDKIVDNINRRLGSLKTPVITRGAMGVTGIEAGWRMKSGRKSPNYTTSWGELPMATA